MQGWGEECGGGEVGGAGWVSEGGGVQGELVGLGEEGRWRWEFVSVGHYTEWTGEEGLVTARRAGMDV